MGDATKQRLLDAGERLFAAQGFASASVRDITRRAKQNLSAISYHFDSKEGLLEAIYRRRCRDLNIERETLLAEADARHAGGPPIDEIVHALLAPSFRWCLDQSSGRATFILFLFRSYYDNSPALKKVRLTESQALRAIFLPALRRALPELRDEDLYWGVQFAMGAMHYAIGDLNWVKVVSGYACDTSDMDAVVQRIVSYVAGGFNRLTESASAPRSATLSLQRREAA